MTKSMPWAAANILAGAATVHDGLFLILKRSGRESFLPDAWGIPAGRIEQDEDPQDACTRELYEESGLGGKVVELLGYSMFSSKRNGVRLSNLQLNFLVLADNREVRLDDRSHSEYRWISLDDVENYFLDSFTRQIIESARMYLKNQSEFTRITTR
jgi:8-oxo-dGTP pyrophosphatase MutT (NUDIX family)